MKQRFLIGLLVCFGLLCARAAFSMPVTDLDAANDNGFINLSWTEPDDVDDTITTYTYRVERSGSGSGPWTDISGSLPEGTAEHTDVNTINNETWYYRVAAWTGSDTAYSNIVFETAYYPQRISGLTANPTFICYETNGNPDSSAITFNLDAGPGASTVKKVTITLLEAGAEIGTITIYGPATGTHTVYWDGSWGDMAATSIGPTTWVAAMGSGEDWIKHNGTYGMTAVATNYNDDESDIAETGTSIGVNVVHIQRPVQVEHTVIGSNPPAYVPPYKVTYQLTKEAYVTIRVYKETATGGLGTLVRRIEENVPQPGEQAERNLTNTQIWDGKNDTGLIVPNGKYIMTIEAHEASGCGASPEDYADTVELVWAVDILRLTDWSSVAITPDNPDGGAINYTLSHDANVTIKIYPEGTTFNDSGLPDPDTNPIITLVDSPRQAGPHTEDWTGVNDTGLLVPNAVYTYVISAQLHGVKAVDYVGNVCPFYGTISVGRKAHKIDPPTNLTSLAMGQRRLQLSWMAPTNNIGDLTYNIYRDTQPITSQNTSLIIGTTSATTWIDIIDTGIIGLDLYYRVTAMDSVCPESYESSACADYESEFSNMLYLQAPSRPELISIAKGRHPTLKWEYPFYDPLWGPRYYEAIFNIYRSDTTPVALTETNRIASNLQDRVRSYTDGDVEYDKTYYYVVTAVNIETTNGLESKPSSPKSGHSYFEGPSNLTAGNEDGPIRLNWMAASGAVGEITYNIYRDKQATVGNPTKIIDGATYYLIKTGVANTTYLDEKTSHGTSYCYRVTAIDGSDRLESLPANEEPCPISEYLIIPIPTGLGATCANRGINLTWNQENTLPTVSYTYKVYRSLEPYVLVGYTAELVAENLVFSQWRDEDVENGTTYYYRVSVVSEATNKEGDPSDTASATSLFLPPTGLTATNDNGVIDLVWTATGGFGEITYNIYRSETDDVSKKSTRAATDISETHWTDITTDSGTTYWYMITGVDAFDNLETDASDSASTTSIYPADPRPQKLRAECVNRAIVLNWEPHSTFTGAVRYTIWRGTSSPPTTVVATNISSTTWTDTNVLNQTHYYYYITANEGPGNLSNEAHAISEFLAPKNLTATNNNGLSINLSWNPTTGFGTISYNIYRDLQSSVSTSSERIASGLTETTYSDAGVDFNTKYYYIVTGMDSYDNEESLPSLSAYATSTHIPPSIASISMTNIDFEMGMAIITYTVANGPAKQVEITIIDQQTSQEVATIIETVGQNGACTTSWDGVWTNEQGLIKHNGWYSARARAMDVDNSLSDWTATTNDAWVDVVHIQQPVTIEYTTSGQEPPVINPGYKITYQLTKDAYVTHRIYDDNGTLVRTIARNVPRIGEWLDRNQKNTDFWDLRSNNGSFVSNGIYYWEVTATDRGDTSIPVYARIPAQPLRLTDLSTDGIAQSSDKARINYTLTTDATVTIKIYQPGTTFTGVLDGDGNPIPTQGEVALVKTLKFSRGEGSHTEEWDGLDEEGLLVANGVYMMSIIALDSHNNRAIDYNNNECPFYSTIPVDRGVIPPTLSWTGESGYTEDGVSPDKDKAGDIFTYRINYAHQDNTRPLASPILHIFKGGIEIDTRSMTEVNPYDLTYTDGKLYTVSIALSELGEDYTYYFEAKDINGIQAIGEPTHKKVGYMKEGPIVDNTPLVAINQIDRGGFPEINCYVTVTDQAGDHLGGLDSDSFTVTEEGVSQTPITVTPPPLTIPLSTALVMDYSGSMSDADVINAEAAANTFVNKMDNTERAAIIKFDETVSLIQGFTSNKGLLRGAISTPYSRGATAFYDAVYLGLTETANQQGRKAIVAFTDGMDNSSTYTAGKVVAYANNNSIPVFTIGLGSVDEQVLSSLAQGTGGKYYYAPTSAELVAIFEEISAALSNQYMISYNTTNSTPDGQLRDVTINVEYKGEEAEDGGMYQSPSDTSPPTGAPGTPIWTAGQYSSSPDISCTWGKGNAQDQESGIVGYYLQIATDPTFTYGIVFDNRVGNVLSYKIENLTDGRIYYARVKAENGSGLYSSWSPVSEGIRIVQALQLTDLSANGISQEIPEAKINYTITAPATVTIKIYKPRTVFTNEVDAAGNPIPKDRNNLVKTLGPFIQEKGSYTKTWDGINDNGDSVSNGIYLFSITATDGAGDQPVDASFFGEIPVQREIEEPVYNFSKDTIYAYPNPVRVSKGEVVTFRYALSEAADIAIKVYTITGDLLWEKKLDDQPAGMYESETWDVRNKGGKPVASGLYLYSVQKNDDKPIIKKLIVVR